MLDITELEKAWQEYLDSRDGGLTSWGVINLTSWMGERMGSVLKEIKRLRADNAILTEAIEEATRRLRALRY